MPDVPRCSQLPGPADFGWVLQAQEFRTRKGRRISGERLRDEYPLGARRQ